MLSNLANFSKVPILTQSEDWALSKSHCVYVVACVVPILTQSEDWALYRFPTNRQDFQTVPILTQSEDWALYGSGAKIVQPRKGSNPHPVRRLGAIHLFTLNQGRALLFQSSPSPKTGRYGIIARDIDIETSSNPHPVRRLGAIRGRFSPS